MKIGDRVRIRPGGVSLFTIVGEDEEGRFLIESVEDAPGRYQFPHRPENLMPAE